MAIDKDKARARQSDWNAKNREKINATKRLWRARNRDKENARVRAWKQSNRDKENTYARAWRAAHPEMVHARNAASYAKDPEGRKQKAQIWKATHREQDNACARARYSANPHIRRRLRAWKALHPESDRTARQRRRARLYNAPINDLTIAQWKAIQAHYGYRCVYCSRKMSRLSQDHLTPLSKGGSHTAANVVPACRSCNSKKGAREPLIPVQPLLLAPLFKEVPAR